MSKICSTFILAALLVYSLASNAFCDQLKPKDSVSKIDEATRIENEGIKLLNEGKSGEGIKLMKQAIGMNEKNGMRHMNLGSILFAQGASRHQKGDIEKAKPFLDEAEEEMQKAVECFLADPGQDPAKFGLAQSYYILGDIQYFVRNSKAKAKEFYEKAVAVNSNPPHEGAARNLKELKFE